MTSNFLCQEKNSNELFGEINCFSLLFHLPCLSRNIIDTSFNHNIMMFRIVKILIIHLMRVKIL